MRAVGPCIVFQCLKVFKSIWWLGLSEVLLTVSIKPSSTWFPCTCGWKSCVPVFVVLSIDDFSFFFRHQFGKVMNDFWSVVSTFSQFIWLLRANADVTSKPGLKKKQANQKTQNQKLKLTEFFLKIYNLRKLCERK